MRIRAFVPLTFPVPRGGFGAVKGTVQIRGDDFTVIVRLHVEDTALGTRDPRVGDENIQPAVEILNGFFHGFFDLLLVRHVDRVCLGCLYSPPQKENQLSFSSLL